MRIVFIKNNTVTHIYLPGAIWKIAKRNLHRDWQLITMTENPLVTRGWLYNPETEELTSP